MQTDALSEEVHALLQQIESYEQLNILLLLHKEPGECWTAERLGARLKLSEELVATALNVGRGHTLLQICTDGPQVHYRYAPATAPLDAAVDQLARAYKEQPLVILKLMAANSIERIRTAAIRTFADAFVLRKDKD